MTCLDHQINLKWKSKTYLGLPFSNAIFGNDVSVVRKTQEKNFTFATNHEKKIHVQLLKNASIVWNFWGKWKKPKYVVIFGYVKEMFVLKSLAAFPTLLRVRACAWVSSFLTSSRKKELRRSSDDGWETNKQQAADIFSVSRILEGFLPGNNI